MHGEGWQDSMERCGWGESVVSISTSESTGSSMMMVELRVSCSDFSRDGDRKGYLRSPSSSDVSTGVRAGVWSGGGIARGDWEKVLMCLLYGEVRKGKARSLCTAVSKEALLEQI